MKYGCGNDDSKSKKLICFHADPLDYHSIVDALKGCCGLFYSFETPSDYPTYDVSYPTIYSIALYHNWNKVK